MLTTSIPLLALLILLTPIQLVLAATTPICSTSYGTTSKDFTRTFFTFVTRTTTVTASVIYATTTVSSGITTIPTPAGFTPVLAETTSVSLQVQAVNAAAAAQKPTTTSYVELVSCTSTVTSTITQIASGKQRAQTTVTSYAATATVPATTFYAACDSNNIVDQGNNVGAGHAIQFTTIGDGAGPNPYNSSLATDVFNSSASGCCVSCQTTPGCAFSVLYTNYDTTNPLTCSLYFRADGVCDGSFSPGPAEYFYDPHDLGTQPGQNLIVSNGPCGQIIYGGGFARE